MRRSDVERLFPYKIVGRPADRYTVFQLVTALWADDQQPYAFAVTQSIDGDCTLWLSNGAATALTLGEALERHGAAIEYTDGEVI